MSSREHVSVSELREMQKCGQRWYYRYVLGMKEAGGPATIRGRAVHSAARVAYRRKRNAEEVTEEIAQECAANAFDVTVEADGVRFCAEDAAGGEKRVLGEAKDAAVRHAAAHVRLVLPAVDPVEIESEVNSDPLEPLGGKTLRGRLDLIARVDGGEVIRDLKTTSRREPEDAIHADQQLSVYALLYRMLRGRPPVSVQKDVLVDTARRGVELQHLESTRDDRILDATTESLARVERMRQAGIVPPPADPGSWICSQRWCGFTSVCPFYVQAADRSARG